MQLTKRRQLNEHSKRTVRRRTRSLHISCTSSLRRAFSIMFCCVWSLMRRRSAALNPALLGATKKFFICGWSAFLSTSKIQLYLFNRASNEHQHTHATAQTNKHSGHTTYLPCISM